MLWQIQARIARWRKVATGPRLGPRQPHTIMLITSYTSQLIPHTMWVPPKKTHRHVSNSANQHTVRWSLVCRCGATNMEQSANPTARLWTVTWTIQAVTKDTSLQAYIWLLTAASPSDCVFRALGTNWLTYLLTYLLSEVKIRTMKSQWINCLHKSLWCRHLKAMTCGLAIWRFTIEWR